MPSRARALSAALGLVAALAGSPGCGPGGASTDVGSGASSIRNVLLVVIDTLRADHVGAYGYARDTTPNLDALAARGAVFEQAIAPSSWTRASMASVMTGLHPTAAGVTEHNFRLPKADGDVLPGAVDTLAERLSAAGLHTAAVVANINVDPLFGFDQGFDEMIVVSAKHGADDPDWRLHEELMSGTTGDVTAAALEQLDARAADGAPFFLWLHYLDPHDPYEPPAALAERYAPDGYDVDPGVREAVARYDAELRSVDADLGRVLARLEASGLRDDTAVLVVSDHGEEFLEHGGTYHGWTLYDEQLHVPFVAVLPGVVTPGTRIAAQVRTLDLVPTVLDALGRAPPADLDGESLLPLLAGDPEPARTAFAERGYRPWVALRAPPWKLVKDLEQDRAWLFDLANDPGETRDVSASHPDVVAQLLAAIEATRRANERARHRDPDAAADPELSQQQLEQLRALGYTGDEDR